MASFALGAVVHFVSVFLVDKNDCNEFGRRGKVWVRRGEESFPRVTEDEGANRGPFGLSGAGGFDELTRPHGEVVGSNEEVDCVLVQVCSDTTGPSEGPEASQQLGCDGFLTVWRGVYVVVGPEEGTERWQELSAVLDVKGAPFEMVPERRSQVACGSAQSRCHHGVLTFATKSS